MTSTPEFTLRTAQWDDPQDAQWTLALLDAYAQDPMGGGEPLSPYARTHLIDALRQRPGHVVILAFTAGAEPPQAVGLVIALEGFSTFAARPLLNIHDVVVLPPWRGQGLAGRMLARVEAIARARGCCKLTMEVLQGNTPAQAAYRKIGFAGYELDPAMGQALFWQKSLVDD